MENEKLIAVIVELTEKIDMLANTVDELNDMVYKATEVNETLNKKLSIISEKMNDIINRP